MTRKNFVVFSNLFQGNGCFSEARFNFELKFIYVQNCRSYDICRYCKIWLKSFSKVDYSIYPQAFMHPFNGDTTKMYILFTTFLNVHLYFSQENISRFFFTNHRGHYQVNFNSVTMISHS